MECCLAGVGIFRTKPLGESTIKKRSCITLFAIGTLVLLGTILAAHTGGLSISSAAMSGLYVGTGLIVTTLFAVIFSKRTKSESLPYIKLVQISIKEAFTQNLLAPIKKRGVGILECKGMKYVLISIGSNLCASPVVTVPDTFELTQIPPGKKLFVLHQGIYKEVASEGVRELSKCSYDHWEELAASLLLFTMAKRSNKLFWLNAEACDPTLLNLLAAKGRVIATLHPLHPGHFQLHAKTTAGTSHTLFVASTLEKVPRSELDTGEIALYMVEGVLKCTSVEGTSTVVKEKELQALFDADYTGSVKVIDYPKVSISHERTEEPISAAMVLK